MTRRFLVLLIGAAVAVPGAQACTLRFQILLAGNTRLSLR